MAPVTNYHILSGLKQQEFILLQIWTSEMTGGVQGAESDRAAGVGRDLSRGFVKSHPFSR